MSVSLGDGREHRDDDRRNVAELNDSKNHETALAAQKPLTSRPRIRATLIGTANGAVDQIEVCDSGMLFEHLS
jgi:hypothetical protein